MFQRILYLVYCQGLLFSWPLSAVNGQEPENTEKPISLFSPSQPNLGWSVDEESERGGADGELSLTNDSTQDPPKILVFKGDFSGGLQSVGISRSFPPAPIAHLSLQIKSRDNQYIRIRVSNSYGQHYDFIYAIPHGISWHTITLPIMSLMEDMKHTDKPYLSYVVGWSFDGAGRKIWTAPASSLTIYIDPVSDHRVVSIQLADISVTSTEDDGKKLLAFVNESPTSIPQAPAATAPSLAKTEAKPWPPVSPYPKSELPEPNPPTQAEIEASNSLILDSSGVFSRGMLRGPLVKMGSLSFLPSKLAGQPFNDAPHSYGAKEGSFEIQSTLPGNKTIKFFYRIPIDSNNNIPESASNVVFYSPFTEEVCNNATLSRAYPGMKELTETYGLTVFTWNIVSKLADIEDESKFFYYAESGSYDTFKAGYAQLINQMHLDHRRLLMIGQSGGSTFAERFSVANPDLVESIAICGGARYERVDGAKNQAWCVLHTRDDARESDNVSLVNDIRNHGMNAVYGITPVRIRSLDDWLHHPAAFHHSMSDQAWAILEQFTAAIAQLRSKGKASTDYLTWPFSSSVSNPFHVEQNAAPPTHISETTFFPSEDFVKTWSQTPFRYLQLSDSSISRPLPVTICYPVGRPAGVIVMSEGSTVEERDDLEYLAGYGFIVVGANYSLDDKISAQQNQLLAQWTYLQNNFKPYPIFMAGKGSGGRQAIVAACQNGNPRLLGVSASEAPLDWAMPELSPLQNLNLLHCNLALICAQQDKVTGNFIYAAKQLNKKLSVITPTGSAPNTDLEQLDDMVTFFQSLL